MPKIAFEFLRGFAPPPPESLLLPFVYLRHGEYVFALVCLFVCLLVKTTDRILVKILPSIFGHRYFLEVIRICIRI